MSGQAGFPSAAGFGSSSFGGFPSAAGSRMNFSAGLYQAANNGTPNSAVINQFKFLAARSIRTSTIILATFNVISAFATAAGILYDSYATARRNRTGGKGKVSILKSVQPPETFPVILSLGIVFQGIIFAVSQSRGLDSLFAFGCSLISSIMWPAVFIVPYIQLVFGIECTIRAMRTRPFPSRGKWTVTICLAVITMMLLATGLVGFFIRARDFCFASLFWFVSRWAEAGFVILMLIFVLLTICGITIFLRLTRNAMIDNTQRVAASRMVYYLALGALSTAFMIPFFLNLTINNPRDGSGGPGLTLSMIATVVANVSGLMTGGLHLFLRSNTISTIGPKNKKLESDRIALKDKIRVRGPTDIGFGDHILQPVPRSLQRQDSQASLVSHEKEEEEAIESSPIHRNFSERSNPNPLRSNAVYPFDLPKQPEPAQTASTVPSSTLHNRKPSTFSMAYSLFPSKPTSDTTSITLLPSTTYSPNSKSGQPATYSTYSDFEDLKPPPSIRVPGRHRRDSSMASSATVQIGLRLSSVEDMPPMASTIVAMAPEIYNLDCPKERDPADPKRPSPLTQAETAQSTGNSKSLSGSSNPQRDPVRDAKMKTLPPVPREISNEPKENELTLSPSVYSPISPTKAKLPSPKGVGFVTPKRSNTDLAQSTANAALPRPRGNSSAATQSKGDWI